MTGVDDTTTLVQAVNAAIQSADTTAGASNGAFAAAGITASIHTDSLGKQQLAFSSSNSAFQVTANDLMSNALMGNLAVAGAPTGAAAGTAGSSLIAGVARCISPTSISLTASTWRAGGQDPNMTIGQLMLKAGWYSGHDRCSQRREAKGWRVRR